MHNKIMDKVCAPYIEAQNEMKSETEMRERISKGMSNNTQHVIMSVTDMNRYMQTAVVHIRLDFMYENTARADLIEEKIMSDIEDVLAPYFDTKINVEYLTDKEYNEQ